MQALVQESLDTDEPFPLIDEIASAVAQTLLCFLDSLVQPVIPYGFFPLCIDAAGHDQNSELAVSRLPPVHMVVFEYICQFLRLIVLPSNSSIHDTDLAVVFGNVIIKPPPYGNPTYDPKWFEPTVDVKRSRFILYFLKVTID